ncbi:MAG: HAD-IA family hydrolase [Candidatus Azambacteria bacterium]|nr:HAD-IA family hydrolase [Candidatus Azambacteria bacterium]
MIKAIIIDAGGVLYLNHQGKGYLNEPLLEFMRAHQGHYRFGIISTTDYDLKAILEKDSIGNLFNVILTSGETGLSKAEPLIYQQALSSLGTIPEETIFIDNDEVYIKTAGSVGIKTILYIDFENCEKQLTKLTS